MSTTKQNSILLTVSAYGVFEQRYLVTKFTRKGLELREAPLSEGSDTTRLDWEAFCQAYMSGNLKMTEHDP